MLFTLLVVGPYALIRLQRAELIFDLLRRPLYTHLVQLAGMSVGAVLIAACLARLRWRSVA